MVFALRIDVESYKGIREGVPKILDLLKKYNVKASFYLVMGGESSLFDLLRYRKKLVGERGIKVYTLREKLRMSLFPRDFVFENLSILKRILEEGHELGIHGWKHRPWTRGLDKIDIEKHINLAIDKYVSLFGKYPTSFVAPAFQTNNKIVDILDKKGIKIIGDFPGTTPKKLSGVNIVNVPVTISGKNSTPIIEYLVSIGYNDEKILSYLKDVIKKKKYSVIYIHDLFECIHKIELLDKLFEHLKKNKVNILKINGIAAKI